MGISGIGLGALLALAAVSGCADPRGGARSEGTIAGDCADGADNDADGLVDCGDPGCAASPACGAAVDGGPGGPIGAYTFPPRDFVCATDVAPCATATPAESDAERTVTLPPPMVPARTVTYLVSTLSIPARTVDRAAGFNLDGMHSELADVGTCEQDAEDYRGLRDVDHVGVDNGFLELLPFVEDSVLGETCPGGPGPGCVDAFLQDRINTGELLLALEVSEIESFEYDPEVRVAAYELAPSPVSVDGRGAPSAGQSFSTGALLASGRGDVYEGRLRVQLDSLPLDAAPFTADLHRVELRGDISEGALQNGQIGGAMDIDAIVARERGRWSAVPEATVRGVVAGYADIAPISGSTNYCRALSIGYAFEGVPMTRR